MDIRQALVYKHSKSQCQKIVDYIGSDEQKFARLMKVFLEGEYRLTQRAAWPLSYCIEQHPALVKPYFKVLFGMLQKPGVHSAVARNIVRLLQHVGIPKRYHGKTLTICFDFIADPQVPVAIKAFSLTLLDRLSGSYPEIKSELRLIIEERWDHETPAFKSRAKKILGRI